MYLYVYLYVNDCMQWYGLASSHNSPRPMVIMAAGRSVQGHVQLQQP